MNILDTIIARKRIEVEEAKLRVPASELERSPAFGRPVYSLRHSLSVSGKTGIIAEFKRKSPSKGIFNANARVEDITKAYADGGASGLSVLTDRDFFAGADEDLKAARFNTIPILRKDFIIDEYQLLEARALGADVILLIAACLEPKRVKELAAFAQGLKLEVLLEIHNREELGHICDEVDLVGVNNRDLKTFTVDVQRSIELSNLIPTEKVKISESGISDVNTIRHLTDYGFKGFLIGETFMKQPDPAIAFQEFVKQLNEKQHEN